MLEAEKTAAEVVVSKKARVVEEIDLKKRSDDATETVTETIRHTEVDIEDGRDGETIDRKVTRNADYL
jgi:stress response protein YsnF